MTDDQDLAVLLGRWEQYRQVCFARYGTSDFWVWAAAAPCDLYVPLLSVMNTPGFSVDLTRQAACVTAFGEQHLIPLAQMTQQSLADLQLLIVEGHRKATEVQRTHVHRRFNIDGPPEDFNGIVH
jgi:hypothetical protein